MPTVRATSLTAGTDLRAAAGAVVYLTLALLSLGVAAAVRNSAAAIGLVHGVLYLVLVVASLVSEATLARRRLQQIGPLSAGLDIQVMIGVRSLPLTPWQGLGVVALWTAGALLLGALVLESQDARRLRVWTFSMYISTCPRGT